MPFFVRAATPADAGGLARVQAAAAPDAPVDDWLTWTRRHPDDLLFVAETYGQGADGVSGYALARPHPFHGADAEVLALHVLPARRGRGVGTALLRRVLEELADGGARSVGCRFPAGHAGGVAFGGEALGDGVFVWRRLADLATVLAARA